MTDKPKSKVEELRESLKKRSAMKPATHDEVTEADETVSDDTVSNSTVSGDAASSDIDMDAELASAREEAKTHYEKLLRAMADFENYRKRMERDKQDLVRYANEELIGELLGVLDHLDQALSHIKQSSNDEAKNLALGVELVGKQLVGALEKFGLKSVDAVGQMFDPKVHEALQMVDAEDMAPGTVVAQHRRGYVLNGRLLRPALVDVVREH
jgi:molecular chaperone GrpE